MYLWTMIFTDSQRSEILTGTDFGKKYKYSKHVHRNHIMMKSKDGGWDFNYFCGNESSRRWGGFQVPGLLGSGFVL